MEPKGTLNIFETAELLSEAAADFVIHLAAESIEQRGRFVISLSGGNTPAKLYCLLATPELKHQIEWNNTFVFWGDERCVPLDDERNNSYMAKLLLLDKIDIPLANIYPVPVDLPPAESAKAYEETLKTFFGKNHPSFDLILLGLGNDGHTASLFPATPVLTEAKSLVKEVYVVEQQMFRITMTAPLINQARNITFLVTGKEKVGIMKALFSNSTQSDQYPAQLIKPTTGNLFWFVDREAAAQIK